MYPPPLRPPPPQPPAHPPTSYPVPKALTPEVQATRDPSSKKSCQAVYSSTSSHTSSWALELGVSNFTIVLSALALRPLLRLFETSARVRPLLSLVEASARAVTRPLVNLVEASARSETMRLSPRFLSWVAPRACATSARLIARCGGVWRAIAMSLPQGTGRGVS
jgi:hypothetical protein